MQGLNNSTSNSTAPSVDAESLCLAQHTTDAVSECIFPAFGAAVGGEGVFAVLVAGVLYAALWVAGGGDFVTPTAVLSIGGAVLVPVLPQQYRVLAYALVVVGLAAPAFSAGVRFFLSQGVSR
jgi:hypothetical protein